MAAMKVTIVIVNWNSGLQLKACVDSIAQFGGEHVEKIIVVDNGSVDGSEMAVDEDPNVALIRTGENLGFGAACNIGAQAGNSPYILFLNPDTCLKAGSLSIPLDFMGRPENAKVGICGIQLVDEQGNVSRTCSRYPTLGRLVSSALGLDKLPGLEGSGMHMRDWDHKDTRQVDQVIGAFYLMRRDLFEHAGDLMRDSSCILKKWMSPGGASWRGGVVGTSPRLRLSTLAAAPRAKLKVAGFSTPCVVACCMPSSISRSGKPGS